MPARSFRPTLHAVAHLLWLAGLAGLAGGVPAGHAETAAAAAPAPAGKTLDRSGHPRVGKASWYGHRFAGRTMADGTPMKPESNNAASRTLPLGTTARVTNLDNGKSAVVRIRDRGPYVDGRIIDVSPSTARRLDMLEDGVVPVKVEPIHVPGPEDNGREGVVAQEG